MIKVFTTNKNGKIELTAKELKEILDEAYWEGYRANNHLWTYTTPNWTPYVCTANGTNTTVTLNAEDVKTGTATVRDISNINVASDIGYGKGVSVSRSNS